MPNHAQQHRPDRLRRDGTGHWRKLLQVGNGEGIERWVDGCRDGLPGLPHRGEGWGAGWLAVAHQGVESRHHCSPTLALEPVALFVIGEVADHPAQAIHRFKPATGLLFANAGKGAAKFGSGEAQLVDERVGHRMVSFGLCPRRGGVLHGVLIDSENLERIPRRSNSYLDPASYAV